MSQVLLVILRSQNLQVILENIKDTPQLIMPAGNDHANVKAGGLAERTLAKNGETVKVLEFPDMVHGWSVRGDLQAPGVARDTNRALQEAIAFFDQYLV